MSIQGNPFTIHDSSLVLSLDAANIKSFRGEPTTNVVPNPLDLFAWCINGASFATLSRDTSSLASPAGGIPMRMTTTGSDPYTSTYNGSTFNLNAASQGQVWTMSVWAKANRILTCELFLFEANSSGVYINLSTVSISVTTEWQRFTLSRTNTEATVAYVQVRLDGPNTYSAGDIVWWDGLQVEQKAYATTFVSGSRGTSVATGGGLYDLTNGNNNGTLVNGPTYTSSFGGSIVFDGTNDYVSEYSIPDSFWNAGSWTANVWVKFTTVSKGLDNAVFGHGAVAGSGGLHLGERNSAAYFGFYGNDIGGTVPLSANTWYNIVWVFNYSTKLKQLYVNGVFDTSGGTVGYGGTGTNTEIGRYPWAASYLMSGNISLTSLYNRVLSASEILQNYNSAKSRFGL
jgi:hypothetical protein